MQVQNVCKFPIEMLKIIKNTSHFIKFKLELHLKFLIQLDLMVTKDLKSHR